MNKKKMMGYFIPFLCGLIGVLLLAAFMYLISLDLRLMALVSIIGFFGCAWNLARRGYPPLRSSILMLIFPVVFFYLVLAEIPGLYFIIPVVIVAVSIGFYLYKMERKWQIASLVLLSAVSVYSFVIIPGIVQEQLVRVVEEPSPQFEFTTMEGESISSESLKGEVVILDFFGTWCKPCIQELKDLKEIEKDLEKVQFFVVSTDQQGDSPEKVRAFASRYKLNYRFGYDKEGEMHRSFGFTGVPALVIIDKVGNVRMKHEGYNVSENLTEVIRKKVNELLDEN